MTEIARAGIRHSPSIEAVAKALVAAQADLPAVLKDSENPHYKSKYASLDAVVPAVRGPLAKHGLAVVQGAESPNGEAALTVETLLVHTSGEWFANTVVVPIAKVDPQGAGSALTYGRRYGLSALLSLATDDDDDAESAEKRKPPARRRSSRKPPARSIKAEVPSVATTPRAEGEDDARPDQLDRIYQIVAKLDALGSPGRPAQVVDLSRLWGEHREPGDGAGRQRDPPAARPHGRPRGRQGAARARVERRRGARRGGSPVLSDHVKRFRQAQREYERELALGGELQVGAGEDDSGVPPVPPGADTPDDVVDDVVDDEPRSRSERSSRPGPPEADHVDLGACRSRPT